MERHREPQITFGAFRIDPADESLWREEERLSLTPKAFAVLRFLVVHRGCLVTKDEMLTGVWPDTIVGDAVVRVCIREIRKALDDDATNPQYIDTVHRRGYRFIAPCAEHESSSSLVQNERRTAARIASPRNDVAAPRDFVGRVTDLEQLDEALDHAREGESRVVFVAGEAGLGKTTLLEAFAARATAGGADVLYAHGQCIAHYGPGEPYLPVLDAMTGLLTREGAKARDLLERHAPTWLQQMPGFVDGPDRDEIVRRTLGANRERMLREMALFLDALTEQAPLLLVLEDLHWSDTSTLDLISFLGNRRDTARLLLIGSYRRGEAEVAQHPVRALVQELGARGRLRKLEAGLLKEHDLAAYLDVRFRGHAFPDTLAARLFETTGGHPFFLVHVVDDLVGRRVLIEAEGRWTVAAEVDQIGVDAPENVRDLITRQLERLEPLEQQILEGASVAGLDFPSVGVAAVTEMGLDEVEEICERLAGRGQFLRTEGVLELPDHSVTARFAFLHSLYRSVLYERLSATRRVRSHRRYARRGVEAYGRRVTEIAAEMAVQFEAAREHETAISHRRQAADNAVRRHANAEAVEHLDQALRLVEQLTEPHHRVTLEDDLLEQLGVVHRSAGQMEAATSRFEALAERAGARGAVDLEVRALLYLASALSWIDRDRSLAAVARVNALLPRVDDPLLRAHAEGSKGYWTVLLQGWTEPAGRSAVDAVTAAEQARDPTLRCIHVTRSVLFEGLQGRYTEAIAAAEKGEGLALGVGDAFDYLLTRYFGGWARLAAGEWATARRCTDEAIDIAERNAHEQWSALFLIELGRLFEQVGAFQRAASIALAILAGPRREHDVTAMRAWTLLGGARLGQKDVDEAASCFDAALAVNDRPVLLDWICRMPLHRGRSAVHLARGEHDAAREQAKRALELATGPGEPSEIALARAALADIAWDAGDRTGAEREIMHAIEATEGTDARPTTWRVHDRAARIMKARRKKSAALDHTARRDEILRSLDHGLTGDPELSEAFGEHPERR